MFLDVSTFFFFEDKNITTIWRTAMVTDCISVAVQGDGAKLGFWGVISAKGTGCCKLYAQNMNADLYSNVIKNELVASVHMWQLEGNGIYLQNNATYHKTSNINDLFYHLSINLLPWPSRSPDLNSVEQLWTIIDKELRKFLYVQ